MEGGGPSARTTNETRSADPRLFRRRVPSTFEPCVFNPPTRRADTLKRVFVNAATLLFFTFVVRGGMSMAFEICTTRVTTALHEEGEKEKGLSTNPWKLICFEGRVLRIFSSLNTFNATIFLCILNVEKKEKKKSLYVLRRKKVN